MDGVGVGFLGGLQQLLQRLFHAENLEGRVRIFKKSLLFLYSPCSGGEEVRERIRFAGAGEELQQTENTDEGTRLGASLHLEEGPVLLSGNE